MVSLLEDDIEQRGELTITAADFDDGERMPDYVGNANENENPELEIDGIPDQAESLVVVMDDPGTKRVAGFTFDHWLVWNVDPDIGTVPRDWDPSTNDVVVGFNDIVEADYCGPSPASAEHAYRFKVLALDSALELAPEARKAVLDVTISRETEILASAQLIGAFDPSQGSVL